MSKHIIAGLDIGTSAIRVAVVEVERGGKSPRVLALIKRPSRGLRRGYVVSQEDAAQAVGEALREGERAARRRLRQVILAIGGITLESHLSDGQVVIVRPDAEITDTDIARAVELSENNLPNLANEHIIHTLPIGFKLDGKKIYGRPEGLRGTKLEAHTLFITSLKQHVHDLIRAVEANRVEVTEVVAAPLAGSLSLLTPAQKTAGVAVVNIGAQTTSIIVFEDGLPLSVKVFPVGASDITNDIALGLQIKLEEAEHLKLNPDNQNIGTKRKLYEIVEARLSDIFDYLNDHLKKIGKSALLPAGAIFIGSSSHAFDLERLARQALRLPIRVPTRAEDSHALPREVNDASWATAYGLCLYALDNHDYQPAIVAGVRRLTHTLGRWFKELLP